MARRRTLWTALVALAIAAVAGADTAVTPAQLDLFERLSQDLRGIRLDAGERAAIATEIAVDDAHADAVYVGYVDRWLERAAIERFVGTFLRFPPNAIGDPDAETFFHRLSRYQAGSRSVYYLPHTVAAGPEPYTCADRSAECAPAGHDSVVVGKPPCADGAVERVRVWWAREPVEVCRASYVPERIFDDMGYCSGEAEPFMRQPPRAGCGCGPMLMGCLPPAGENPALDALVHSSVVEEWYGTASRIVADNHPLDELVTTTRTWQTGLAEFLYLRRDLIAMLRQASWSAEVQERIEGQVAAVDVYAEARWVAREGLYQGSGLWWTALAPAAFKIPVRSTAHHLLASHLCSTFHAINVDADAILQAVGRQDSNLRTLSSIAESPMRTQKGCRGCHGPMDGAAGFLAELQAPMYGSHPTGQPGRGELMVSGARDLRGDGEGIAALAELVVAQPEFETCSVRRAFETVLHRPVRSADQKLFESLLISFRASGHRWRPTLRALLLSDVYRDPDDALATSTHAPVAALKEVPAVVAEVMQVACAVCHDPKHVLDLTVPPPVDDLITWKKIWTRLSDFSMPPPAREGEVIRRFPLDPSVRTAMTGAIATILGPALDARTPPRRMPYLVWTAVARDVGGPILGEERVDQIIDSHIPRRGLLAKLEPRGHPPGYLLAIERASESLCRAVAAAELEVDGGPHGLTRLEAWPEVERAAAVSRLLADVYGRPPTAAELESGGADLEAMQAAVGTWSEAWIGLCSTHLSGMGVMFGATYEEASLR